MKKMLFHFVTALFLIGCFTVIGRSSVVSAAPFQAHLHAARETINAQQDASFPDCTTLSTDTRNSNIPCRITHTEFDEYCTNTTHAPGYSGQSVSISSKCDNGQKMDGNTSATGTFTWFDVCKTEANDTTNAIDVDGDNTPVCDTKSANSGKSAFGSCDSASLPCRILPSELDDYCKNESNSQGFSDNTLSLSSKCDGGTKIDNNPAGGKNTWLDVCFQEVDKTTGSIGVDFDKTPICDVKKASNSPSKASKKSKSSSTTSVHVGCEASGKKAANSKKSLPCIATTADFQAYCSKSATKVNTQLFSFIPGNNDSGFEYNKLACLVTQTFQKVQLTGTSFPSLNGACRFFLGSSKVKATPQSDKSLQCK